MLRDINRMVYEEPENGLIFFLSPYGYFEAYFKSSHAFRSGLWTSDGVPVKVMVHSAPLALVNKLSDPHNKFMTLRPSKTGDVTQKVSGSPIKSKSPKPT